MGTRSNRLNGIEVVLTSTHNLRFGPKIIKICIPLHTPVLLHIKVGFKGVFIAPEIKIHLYLRLHGYVFLMFHSEFTDHETSRGG